METLLYSHTLKKNLLKSEIEFSVFQSRKRLFTLFTFKDNIKKKKMLHSNLVYKFKCNICNNITRTVVQGNIEKYTVKLLPKNPLYPKLMRQNRKNRLKLEEKYTQLFAICEYKTKQLENIKILIYELVSPVSNNLNH